MSYKAILWDVDGTLVDSQRAGDRFARRRARRDGISAAVARTVRAGDARHEPRSAPRHRTSRPAGGAGVLEPSLAQRRTPQRALSRRCGGGGCAACRRRASGARDLADRPRMRRRPRPLPHRAAARRARMRRGHPAAQARSRTDPLRPRPPRRRAPRRALRRRQPHRRRPAPAPPASTSHSPSGAPVPNHPFPPTIGQSAPRTSSPSRRSPGNWRSGPWARHAAAAGAVPAGKEHRKAQKNAPAIAADAFCVAEKEGFEPSRQLSHPTPLAGEPLRPLGYFSIYWRRERDSNPRCLAASLFSRPAP